MDRYDSRAALVNSIQQALDHPAVDAETLGRTVLMLEWFVESGVLDAEDVARLLAERTSGQPSAVSGQPLLKADG